MPALEAGLMYRFPGMDPWLEHRWRWPGVHDALIIHIAETLTAQLAPRYVARPGQRAVVEVPDRQTQPDVTVIEHDRGQPNVGSSTRGADEAVTLVLETLEVNETFVEVRSVQPDRRLVTVLEVLSLSNKRAGADSREKYLRKQSEVLSSEVHLVEIDLLRGGDHTVAVPRGHLDSLAPHEYRIVVRRADGRGRAQVYPVPLPKRLPRIAVPLLTPDPDAVLDLQQMMERVYQAGGYGLDMDYRKAPEPPLSEANAQWARSLLGLA